MTPKDFHELAKEYSAPRCLVYAVVNASEVIIYIGSGTHSRAVQSCKEKGGEKLFIVECDDRLGAYKLEAELIAKHLPIFNYFIPKINGAPQKKIRPFTRERYQLMRRAWAK